jgi:hypothetical protein
MPDDTSPHGGEALHPLPDRAQIPQRKPGAGSTERPQDTDRPDVARRPDLPARSEPMAADVEDEDDDPVVESGPGVAEETGKPSVTRQPGDA